MRDDVTLQWRLSLTGCKPRISTALMYCISPSPVGTMRQGNYIKIISRFYIGRKCADLRIRCRGQLIHMQYLYWNDSNEMSFSKTVTLITVSTGNEQNRFPDDWHFLMVSHAELFRDVSYWINNRYSRNFRRNDAQMRPLLNWKIVYYIMYQISFTGQSLNKLQKLE